MLYLTMCVTDTFTHSDLLLRLFKNYVQFFQTLIGGEALFGTWETKQAKRDGAGR